MLESDIEKAVKTYARSKGVLTYKFTSPNRASVPDDIFITKGGILFFVEFKAPGKKATLKQQREISRLRDHGQIVYVIDNIQQGKDLVDAYTARSLFLSKKGD